MLEINSLIFSFSKVNSFSEIIFSKTSSFFSKLSFWEKSWTLCEAVSFSSGWNLGKIKTLKKIKTIAIRTKPTRELLSLFLMIFNYWINKTIE